MFEEMFDGMFDGMLDGMFDGMLVPNPRAFWSAQERHPGSPWGVGATTGTAIHSFPLTLTQRRERFAFKRHPAALRLDRLRPPCREPRPARHAIFKACVWTFVQAHIRHVPRIVGTHTSTTVLTSAALVCAAALDVPETPRIPKTQFFGID